MLFQLHNFYIEGEAEAIYITLSSIASKLIVANFSAKIKGGGTLEPPSNYVACNIVLTSGLKRVWKSYLSASFLRAALRAKRAVFRLFPAVDTPESAPIIPTVTPPATVVFVRVSIDILLLIPRR